MIESTYSQEVSNTSFPLGEHIKFKIYYGWFGLGEASMSIADSLITVNNEHFYRTQVEAKTTGLFSWISGIQNIYWGDVNTGNYKTIVSEKHINDRKGKFDQWNTFDYDKMQTDVVMMKYYRDEPRREVTVDLTKNTYDIHGTYMYLRSKLWSGFNMGDSLLMTTYWEDDLYDFGMEYGGTNKIKFDGKKVTAHKFYALFPVSGTFPKEKAVTFWIMEKNGVGIPLLIEAEMKIGKVRCELKEYSAGNLNLMVAE